MAERHLQAKIVRWLRESGCFVRAVSQDSYGSGLPDVFAIKDGKTLWFEVKTGRGRLRKVQRLVIMEMVKAGAKVYVVRSLREVKRFLG